MSVSTLNILYSFLLTELEIDEHGVEAFLFETSQAIKICLQRYFRVKVAFHLF